MTVLCLKVNKCMIRYFESVLSRNTHGAIICLTPLKAIGYRNIFKIDEFPLKFAGSRRTFYKNVQAEPAITFIKEKTFVRPL